VTEAVSCACEQKGTQHARFERRIGCDETRGRYADVDLHRCQDCGRRWLRYFVEYESYPALGRWACGLISPEDAERVTPEAAAAYLENLPWYVFGGSYFYGAVRRKSGPMNWGS
jgi:hypothetical protein